MPDMIFEMCIRDSYTTSDISVGSKHVAEIASRKILAPWKNKKLIPGTVVVFRGYGRPTPGVFMLSLIHI